MRKKQDGSVLLWAVMMIAVIMIIVVAGLSISFSYYQRSMDNNSKHQAYITSKASADTMISILASDDEQMKSKMIPVNVNDVISIADISFTLPSSASDEHIKMGSTSAKITRKTKVQIELIITCELNDMEASMIVYMHLQNNVWNVESYQKGPQ